MTWQTLAILVTLLVLTAGDDVVDMIAPKVEHVVRNERKEPGVCSEACYKIATCNEEIGGRCDCPKHLAGVDCSRNASASRMTLYGQAAHLEAKAPMPCLNNCTQRGHCILGACVCDRGNFSSDCSMSLDAAGKPVLLAGSGYQPRERRPRIYVYDIPHKFSSWYNPTRVDRELFWVFWERLLGSGAVVADGEEADWFWLPVKLRSTTDGYRLLEAIQYVRTEWPWYDRLQGHRHFVIHTGDTGRGEVAREIRDATANMTWLHHWGLWEDWNASGWKAAHRPGKIGLALFVSRCGDSGLLGSPTRDVGGVDGWAAPPGAEIAEDGHTAVRGAVHYHHHNRTGYKIVTGDSRYPLDLLTYKYVCDCVLVSVMGCLPLIISDSVMQPFEPEMDWDRIGLRLAHEDIPTLHERLAAISDEELDRRRAALRCAVQHLLFSSLGGALMQEDGRWDAFEFIFEILRMQQTYPGLDPRRYADTDPQYRHFLHCGDPDGMEAYGRKLQEAHLERYPTASLPQVVGFGGIALAADGASAAAGSQEEVGSQAGFKMTMSRFDGLLAQYAMKVDRVTQAEPLVLCSSTLKFIIHISRTLRRSANWMKGQTDRQTDKRRFGRPLACTRTTRVQFPLLLSENGPHSQELFFG
ncbi:acetylglucosaminyltransferase [Volvox carteri f. nagariensis]|uniref:Acetylglucosaminyltransferase n=1 Tax=Volvox carteri f. nagariensis TaxID=3068 RepID=D8TNG1_VOLCA|nr:acetylglucosaminyltransferase [Volvox carteri f. nagariensis]EFJ50986.1 acetylglucosaminyltransferase [Volvox carteri f. nagariensis]|eukprot:XP_002947998.1 acetylglucosaminyltransferase [Volvox carteri f. nagariensis]